MATRSTRRSRAAGRAGRLARVNNEARSRRLRPQKLEYVYDPDLDRDLHLSNITDLFTFDLLVRYVACKIEGGGEADRSDHATVLVSPVPIRR
jgi:hypothetical protein